MHRHFTLSFCLLWAANTANAQCPGTPVNLTSQAQVDNFIIMYPDCEEIPVTITVEGNNITNLDGLSAITFMERSLFIRNCPALVDLTGLSNLAHIGAELTFDNCDALTNFDGLENVPFIGGTLTITSNALLNDMSALSSLEYINGSLLISQNPALTDLTGLDNVAFTGRFLQITNNNNLTSLNSLSSLTEVGNNAATIGRYLAIESNPNLTTLNGLNSLESVGTDFEINGNGNLTSLNAFSSLVSVGGEFAITGNPDLPSILEFGALESVGGVLTISNNNVLTDCAAQGICDFLDGSGTAVISNNDPGCNNVSQVEAECALLPVQLVAFAGKRVPSGVLLHWQTATELNNAYFQVEHSLNGRAFKPVGRVEGKGTAQSANAYQFEHRKPASGTNYYRLRQVDFDAKFEYSNIVTVEIESEDVSIYPNPTKGYVNIKKGKNLEGVVRVTDLFGRLIAEQKLTQDNSEFDLFGQPNGIYLIEIQTGNQKAVKKIVKK